MDGAAPGTVSLVGDVMIRRPFAESGRGAAPGFQAAVAALRETDLAVANLEMPLSRRGSRVPKHSSLRSDPDVIMDLRAMGVHAVTLANNHMYDYNFLFEDPKAFMAPESVIVQVALGADRAVTLAPAVLDARVPRARRGGSGAPRPRRARGALGPVRHPLRGRRRPGPADPGLSRLGPHLNRSVPFGTAGGERIG